MKKIFTLLLGIFLSVSFISSQEAPPQAFSFKAMIKDNKNQPVVLKTVSLRISILKDDLNGLTEYCETFRQSTNVYAQVDIEIGRGTVVSGIFSAIDWSAHEYFLKIEVDIKGGTNYQLLSVAQLLSVPYALYAGNLSGGSQDNDDDPLNELISNAYLNGTALVLVEGSRTTIVELAGLLDGVDASVSNELQDLSIDGHQLTIENGNTVTLPDEVDDADHDPLNEIQQLSISGDRIMLSRDGGYVEIPVANTVNGLFAYGDKDNDGYGDRLRALWIPVNVTPPSGYVSNASDCNDDDPLIKPGARDICDGIDNDCDGITDENCLLPECYQALISLFTCAEERCDGLSMDCFFSCYQQYEQVLNCEGGECITSRLMDTETWLIIQPYTIEQKANYFVEQCSSPDDDADGYTVDEGDCNDNDPSVHPGAADIPGDGIDQNCNGHDAEAGDDDDDTYTEAEGDCDDTNPEIHPGMTDICDGLDNDCDGEIDEDASWNTYYLDSDHDGFGDPAVSASYCSPEQASGDNYILIGGDCNDNNPEINPGISEASFDLCGDGIDQDCKDGDLPCSFLEDNDGDEYSELDGDCDDTDNSIYPGAPEICGDGKDQNCNGHDQRCGDEDDDGYTPAEGDCNDLNPAVHPGASEICWDGVDQDCNGIADDGCCIITLVNLLDCAEANGCSYSDPGCIMEHCSDEFFSLQEQYCFNFQCVTSLLADPALPFDETWTSEAKAYYILSKCGMFDNDGDGYSGEMGDCDDTNPAIYPYAQEICGDGIDQNCSGSDASCDDVDEDGYTTDDCDDNDRFTHPGAMELCDGKDNDCNGEIDEGIETAIWFRDADGDGYGNISEQIETCQPPEGYVENAEDCDDADNSINRFAPEICGDGIDQDCDGADQLCPEDIDDDNDGYSENQGDCDDANRYVNPGELESCGDGIDNNCNGLVDEDPDVTPSAVIASSTDLDFGSNLVLAAADPPGLSPNCINFLTYEWDILSDGTNDFAGQELIVSWENLASILGSVTTPAVFSVTLTVSDHMGQSVNSTVNFNIWAKDPVACFNVTPADGYSTSDFTFDGTCSYHPNPNRRIALFEWKVREYYNIFTVGDVIYYNFNDTPYDIVPPNRTRTLEIVLIVTDDLGNVSETSHNITLNDDQDYDGYAIPDDCDDADPNVYPGAIEVCGDGIDQDCDGVDTECVPSISQVTPPALNINNGESGIFTVELVNPAPVGGVTINCTASNACLTVSPSIIVNEGTTTATATVTALCPGEYAITFTLGLQQITMPVSVL